MVKTPEKRVNLQRIFTGNPPVSRLELASVLELDRVHDPDDRDLIRDVLSPADRVARGAAERDDHRLADPRADDVRGDDRRSGGIAGERDRPHEQEANPLERLLLLGRPDLADDASDEHLAALRAARRWNRDVLRRGREPLLDLELIDDSRDRGFD